MTVINNNMSKIIALNDIKNMEKNNAIDVIGIYHSRDLDGYSSGAIIKHKYPNAKLIGFDYGQELNLESSDLGKPIIMSDVSMKMPEMLKLAEKSNFQLKWIDHHISAIKEFKEFVGQGEAFCTAVLDNTISACEGTWRNLFPDKEMPEAILLLGEYDTWRNQDKNRWENKILPFQFGMRMLCNSPETFPQDIFNNPNNSFVEETIETGKSILLYQAQVNESACKGAFEYEFEGLRCICLNGGGFNSDVFKSVYDESKHDAMMPFKYDGKTNQWIFSLYGTKDIDLSIIAKKWGGGGHKQACGFQVVSVSDVFKNIK